ncbi:major pollen allergen Ole e 10-like [Primulina eburnea]|uniref:major pollen allergen Ole e 10-like n=1 Tax=Primulina eburnea TaxID=1245227 RepID=UPI003C6BF25C
MENKKISLLLIVSIFFAVATWKCNAQGPAKTWCVATSTAPEYNLQAVIDIACGNIVNCSPIVSFSQCYYPNTVRNHASFVLNLLYRREDAHCLEAVGVIVTQDPSYGGCHYP